MDAPAASAEPAHLYLTTVGRTTGLPREIEIWFVAATGRYYVLAEHGARAHWVRNIARNPSVRVRLGSRDAPQFDATARALDPERDGEAWRTAQALAEEKHGWSEGLPIEITPAS